MLMSIKNPRKSQIETIFFEVRELPPTEREDFLASACHGDPEARKVIEDLLVADEQVDSLLNGPAFVSETANIGAGHSEEDYEGKKIGPYKLLQRIGEGGFGVVYMAEQTKPVRRKVALKLIKPGMDSKEVIARFEAERQALAMMYHPNIAKVLDAGTTDSGRPYFAMELINGVPITEYCDSNALDARNRLKLFIDVCRAVQHAHQKGIIHRDIKPNNVMVTLHDGKPVPKVIDFGVAKALSQHLTEKTLFTRYGQVVGTPQYMSPEQAEMSGLDIDTRSDIYSLGILLYELLTGHTPLDADVLRTAGYDAMRKMISELEPAKPSTRLRTLDNRTATSVASLRSTVPSALSRMIAGDIDWIVMKCLEKDRGRRYDSATGLLSDVERYLRDDPVEAGPPTIGYQLTKLYHRNRAAMTTLMAIGALLLLGICAVGWAWANEAEQRQIADDQTKAAVAAQETANEERQKAEANAKAADQLKLVAQREAEKANAALELLQSLLTRAAPSVEDGPDVKLVDFLREYARTVDATEFNDKEVEIGIRLSVAEALRNFSLSGESNQLLSRAEHLARGQFPTGSMVLAKALYDISDGYNDRERLLKEALAILDAREEQGAFTVNVLNELAGATRFRPDESEAYMLRAYDLFRTLPDVEQAKVAVLPHRAMASSRRSEGKLDEAIKLGQEAVKLSEEKSPSELIEALLFVEGIHFSRGEIEASRNYLNQAEKIASEADDPKLLVRFWDHQLSRLFWEKPVDIEHRRNLATQCRIAFTKEWGRMYRVNCAWVLGYLHGALLSVGDKRGADEVDRLSRSLPPTAQSQFKSKTAQWMRMHGDISEAIKYYEAGSLESQGDREAIWNRIQCGRAYAAVRDFERELSCLEEAKKLVAESTEAWDEVPILMAHASALRQLGRDEEAEREFLKTSRTLSNQSKKLWGANITAAIQLWSLEEARRDGFAGKESEDQLFEQSYQHLLSVAPSDPLEITYKHAALGMVAERRGDRDEAIKHFALASKNRMGTFAVIYSEWITDRMVELLVEANRIDECETNLREEVKLRDSQVSENHPERAFVRLRLLEFLLENDRSLIGAESLYEVASAILDHHRSVLPKKEVGKLKELGGRLKTALK